MLRTPLLSALCVAVVATFAMNSAQAEGKLNTVEQFKLGNSELAVTTYIEQDKSATTKVGLLSIASPSRNSFAFKLDAWLSMIALWNKAIVVQSANWKVIGTMTEQETTGVSQLTISAGPGVSFMISSPKSGTVSYALDRKDAGRFDKAVLQVRDYLAK